MRLGKIMITMMPMKEPHLTVYVHFDWPDEAFPFWMKVRLKGDYVFMKTIREKQLLVGTDFAGYPLKEAVCTHLRTKGWHITDVGMTDPNTNDTENMFHRIGLRVGTMISEGEFERALIFCGTGMGIHIAASKCPYSLLDSVSKAASPLSKTLVFSAQPPPVTRMLPSHGGTSCTQSPFRC